MSASAPTRILLVDDHEAVRRGLRALIELRAGWEVCGEAGDGRTAVQLARTLSPQIIVMDITMPGLNGLEAARQILDKARDIHVVIFTMHESEHLLREAVSAGARAYVLKSDPGRDLVAAIEAVLQGRPFITPRLAASIHNLEFKAGGIRRPFKPPGQLTPREREVLQLLAEGRTNKEVGRLLGISVKTAETHRARVMRKLNVDSVADLVRYAIRNKFISV